MMEFRDPYLPRIWGLFTVGMLMTGLSIPGYLHGVEKVDLGLVKLEIPAPVRKLSFVGLGVMAAIAAWNETQNRRYWLEDVEEERQHNLLLRRVANQAQLQAHAQAIQYTAQMEAAQQVYEKLAPYLPDEEPRTIDTTVAPAQQTQPPQQLPPAQPAAPAYQQPVQAWTPASQSQQVGGDLSEIPPGGRPIYAPVAPAPQTVTPDPYAYLDLFIEYSGLLFGGQGSGKSWTTRQIVAKKVAAGHRVVVLDPHAAPHEWEGVEHIGAGMDYRAIAQFLRWYLEEVKRRYKAFSQSGLSEDQWQAQMRQQGQVLSVVCEEMTNWADRLPDGISAEFMKTGMSDSRKALMPPLFVAHDRTLSCLGDAKGLARLRDSSLLELELVPKIDEASFRPVASGNGRLKLPGHAQWRDVTLPPATQKITDFRGYGLQRSLRDTRQGSQPSPQETQEPTAPPQPRDRPNRPIPKSDRTQFLDQARQWLQDCWQTEDEEEPTVPELPRDIPDQLKPLIEFCQGRGWVRAADVKGNVRAYRDLSTDAIRAMFQQAVDMGFGKVRGDGNQLYYRVDSQTFDN